MLDLPQRTQKPRKNGITAVHDVRLTTKQLEDILTEHGEFIDVAKLGVGAAYVTPNLKGKIELYKSIGAAVYFGGTLFEKFYYQKKLDAYKEYMRSYGIRVMEISTGTIDIPLETRIALIEECKGEFEVLAEVGTKDADAIMAPSKWLEEITSLLEAGASYVITEGRNSGTAGIYRPSGEVRTGLVADIISHTPVDRIIFEAPNSSSQMFFINQVGANVNLGNVNPNDVLLLEAQRQGLRSETFYLK